MSLLGRIAIYTKKNKDQTFVIPIRSVDGSLLEILDLKSKTTILVNEKDLGTQFNVEHLDKLVEFHEKSIQNIQSIKECMNHTGKGEVTQKDFVLWALTEKLQKRSTSKKELFEILSESQEELMQV